MGSSANGVMAVLPVPRIEGLPLRTALPATGAEPRIRNVRPSYASERPTKEGDKEALSLSNCDLALCAYV